MPVIHLLAGPNGSGKTTYAERVLRPVTHLPFVNADVIATERWPGNEVTHAYGASRAAASERQRLMTARRSFITETVFSHPSKVDLLHEARLLDYVVQLHVMLVPVEVTVARVRERVRRGGHDVPEHKIRERYDRLWGLVATACATADRVEFRDNSRATPSFRLVANYERGRLLGVPDWPAWTPPSLLG